MRGGRGGSHLSAPPKNSADFMREWRDYRAQHGSVPVETPDSAGYALALRIRKARDRYVFDAVELAELDLPILAPAAAQAKSAGAVSESPPNRAGHRVSTGKRSTHASQGSAASAESAGAVAAAARVAQPRSAPTRATPAGSAFSFALEASARALALVLALTLPGLPIG